jgi:hypothetical protein
MSGFSKGKRAFGFCDRTGFRYPIKDLVPEYSNGTKTGFLIGRDMVDQDHPQNFLSKVDASDNQSLRNPRPERSVDSLFGFNPVGTPQEFMIAAGGIARVSIG